MGDAQGGRRKEKKGGRVVFLLFLDSISKQKTQPRKLAKWQKNERFLRSVSGRV